MLITLKLLAMVALSLSLLSSRNSIFAYPATSEVFHMKKSYHYATMHSNLYFPRVCRTCRKKKSCPVLLSPSFCSIGTQNSDSVIFIMEYFQDCHLLPRSSSTPANFFLTCFFFFFWYILVLLHVSKKNPHV